MKIKLYAIFNLLIALVLAAPCFATDGKLRISSGHNPPLANDDHTGFHDLVAKEAYKRIGIDIEIHRLPHARSGINANEGIDDGNGPRIDTYNKYFPNLRMIPEKVIDFDFVGFTKDPSINPQGWDELTDLNVGIVIGWKILEFNVKKYQSLTKVRNAEQLFKLLDHGRADIVLIERWQGLHAARQQGIKNIHVVEPPFARKEMFFYLHKKHEGLVQKVVKALQEIKRDGTYDQLSREKLLPLMPR